MMSTNRQANFAIYFKTSGGCEEAERGRFEGVSGREDDAAVVDSGGESGGRWRAEDREVPFEEVGVERGGAVVGGGLGCEVGGFAEDAFEGWGAGGGHDFESGPDIGDCGMRMMDFAIDQSCL